MAFESGKTFMAQAVVAEDDQDQRTRMRFMRIDAATGELLREFWIVPPTN